MYEVFEHTADIGLRITAPDLAGLFAEAARGTTAKSWKSAAKVIPC